MTIPLRSDSDFVFYSKLAIIPVLENELRDCSISEKDKVIDVVSGYFADQIKTKNGIRIELGLLLRGVTEDSKKLKEEGIDFKEMGIKIPKIRVVLDQKSVEYLRSRLMQGLITSSFCES